MGTDHRPITTQVDDHELQLEQIEAAIHRLAKRLGKMEKLMGQLTTAAIAATAAFDAMKQLMEEQTGLEGDAVLFDQDAFDDVAERTAQEAIYDNSIDNDAEDTVPTQ